MATKRLIWAGVPLVLVIALLIVSRPSWEQQSPVLISDHLQSMNEQELQDEKLRQEILKLQFENERRDSFWELLPSYATFITAFGAVVGIIVTIWKQIGQQEADRRQRENESLRRLDEKFTSIVTNLGSESPAIQAGAAVSIISFLKPEYRAFHDQVFMIFLANLKLQHSDVLNRLLVEGFEKAIRIRLQSVREKDEPFKLDLSGANVYRADLSALDLRESDLGFAKLQGANLANANLYRTRGWKANMDNARLSRANLEEARLRKARFRGAQFHETRLVSADLKETDLTKAQFHRAQMQSAHLEGAKLNGARFEQADVNDTFFYGASLNAETLRSILKALNWQKAHYDDDVRARLEELTGSRD